MQNIEVESVLYLKVFSGCYDMDLVVSPQFLCINGNDIHNISVLMTDKIFLPRATCLHLINYFDLFWRICFMIILMGVVFLWKKQNLISSYQKLDGFSRKLLFTLDFFFRMILQFLQ